MAPPSCSARGPPASPWCVRCLAHLGKETEQECSGTFGPLGHNCGRCSGSRHTCTQVQDVDVLVLVDRVVRARARVAARAAAEEEAEEESAVLKKRRRVEKRAVDKVHKALKALSSRGGKYVRNMLVSGGSEVERAGLLVQQQIARSLAALVELGVARGLAEGHDLSKVKKVWAPEEPNDEWVAVGGSAHQDGDGEEFDGF